MGQDIARVQNCPGIAVLFSHGDNHHHGVSLGFGYGVNYSVSHMVSRSVGHGDDQGVGLDISIVLVLVIRLFIWNSHGVGVMG